MSLTAQNVHSSIGEFQRNYLYKMYIENVPDVLIEKFPNALSFRDEVDIYNTKAVFPDRKTNASPKKYAGEFFYIPTTESNTKEADFEFFSDEDRWAWDFFSACKDLTGNDENEAGVRGIASKINIGIARVSVDKKTITAYRRLQGCRVYGIDESETTKDGEDITVLKVNIKWDRSKEVKEMRGKEA